MHVDTAHVTCTCRQASNLWNKLLLGVENAIHPGQSIREACGTPREENHEKNVRLSSNSWFLRWTVIWVASITSLTTCQAEMGEVFGVFKFQSTCAAEQSPVFADLQYVHVRRRRPRRD